MNYSGQLLVIIVNMASLLINLVSAPDGVTPWPFMNGVIVGVNATIIIAFLME